MTPLAQSTVFFAVMLGLSIFCAIQLWRALHRQNQTLSKLTRVLPPYLTLCAAMDLVLAPYLPHITKSSMGGLLLPLCVLGLPALQHSVLLAAAFGTRAP